jgi:serpin B
MRCRYLALSLILLACGAPAGSAIVNGDAPAEGAARLARSSNTFGFDLYRHLRQNPGNLVISPASLTTALAMTWGGAKGETAAQMRTVLHLEGTADEVMATSGQLARSLQEPSRPIVFRIANQLFGEKTYKLVPAFVEKTRAAFGAPLELLDFKTAPEPARVHINAWVEDRTRASCWSTRSTSWATGPNLSSARRRVPRPSI